MKIISKPHIYASLFLLLISLAGASQAQIPQPERDALIALYNSTGGADWSNSTGWMGAAGTECDWYGITCSNGSVTELRLSGNSLSWSIPSELGYLTNLTGLYLNGNSLSGSIPPELGGLTNLTNLYLNDNSLSGSIPSELGNLTNLAVLNLENNSLSGSVPTSLNSFGISDNAFNAAPAVSISDGNRTIDDTDGAAGEAVSFTATATDSDGSVASSSWLINGAEVASGTSANLTLGDGSTTVTFRATDDDGDSTSTSVTITVVAPVIPNVAPVVAISDGNRSIIDTDKLTGETVSFSATATDADGELASTSWLIGGAEVASGTSANLTLGDGSTTVTFRATDDDGDSTSTSVTITVVAPVIANVAPVVAIIGGNRSIVDTDGQTGESVSLSATATDADGELTSTLWLIGDAEVATGTSANLTLGDGSTTVTFRAIDDDGVSTSTSVTITVVAPPLERDVLIALYNSTGGADWTNNAGWLGAAGTECDWYGITCSNGSVTELRLKNNSLSGSIPSELGNLTNLTTLDLSYNSKEELYPHRRLSSLYNNLSGSSGLSGSIPPELGNLTNLTTLDLQFNSLSGSIPSELGNLTKLKEWDLGLNRLSGVIPPWVRNFPIYQYKLAGNPLERFALTALYEAASTPRGWDGRPERTGWGSFDIAEGLVCDWEGVTCLNGSVTELRLSEMELEGFLPSELGNLTNLTVLDLTFNELTGSLPSELGNLTNLTVLDLAVNELTGSLPSGLGNLTNLTTLNLASNNISGSIPSELGNLTNLTVLDLAGNELTGSLPSWLGNLTNLTRLGLSFNKLTGRIPSELGNLTNLKVWSLQSNRLSGSIPPELGNLPNHSLTFMDNPLERNALFALYRATGGNLAWEGAGGWGGEHYIADPPGTECDWYGITCSNGSVTELRVSGFEGDLYRELQLEGRLPYELSWLTNLTILDLSGHSIGGDLYLLPESPDQIRNEGFGELVNLTKLRLGGNLFTGSIPAELGNLTNLTELNLRSNRLTGSIPSELGNLTNLTTLDLAFNSLTGSIPSELGNLTNLTSLNLDYNSLSGSIPTSLNSFGISDNAFNAAPAVSISGGIRTIDDTDGVAGEVVSVTATATDSDGELASTSWLIGDEVVASGTSARLPLSDGSTTVTFRATDDDGESTSTSVTITVEAPVETAEEFVTEYNGVAAPSFLSEEINTISVFDMNKLKLRSCIRLTLGGEPYSLNDYEQYDMNFNLLSLGDLTFGLVDFRPFNLNGSSNQFGETPDCSGQFELSSNVYKDIIAVPGTTEAGNLKYDYYDLVIDLIDMDSLLFKLRDISIITGSSSVR